MKYESLQVPTGGSDFLKLVSGENRLRIVSEPEARGSHYIQSEKKSYACLGKENLCDFCLNGIDPRVRFLYRVIDRKDGALKLLEVGWSIVGELKKLHDSTDYAFNEIPPYDISILKEGTGLETTYSVLPARMNTPLTPEEEAKIKDAKPLSDFIETMKQKTGVKAEAPIPDIDVASISF